MRLAEHEPSLVHGLGQAPNPVQSGGAFVPAWQEIDAVLAPIVGKRGSAALYERSVQLQLTGAQAGSAALLHTVRELLAPLIGPGLTERLLRSLTASVSAGVNHSQTVESGDRLP